MTATPLSAPRPPIARPRPARAARPRLAALLLAAAVASAGCGPRAGDEAGETAPAAEPAGEVMVFAAASLRDALQEVGTLYREETGTAPVYNFAGSNDLAQQILAAPKADVFLSANEDWMDKVEAAGRLAPGTRGAPLSNRLVVIARTDSPHRLSGPDDLATLPYRHLALANPDAVPAGIYAKEWLASRPAPGGGTLWDAVADRVAPALDVRAALALAESDPEVLGIVYRTDAASSDRVAVLYEVPEAEGPRIRYAVAAVAGGPNPEAGLSFVAFLETPAAAAVFDRHGFVVGAGAEAPAPGAGGGTAAPGGESG
jgi:molybdate transport system substrate-binding protein